MTALPYMKFWVADFYTDRLVQALPADTRALYRVLLDQMWLNDGWLPNNDAVIAKRLGVHHHAWRLRHKPLLTPLLTYEVTSGVIPGGVITQKRLLEEYKLAIDKRARNKARTAPGRLAKAQAKHGNGLSVTEQVIASVAGQSTPPVDASYPTSNPQSTTRARPRPTSEPYKEEKGSAPHMAESPSRPNGSELGGLPPRAGDAAPAVEGHTTPPAHEAGAGENHEALAQALLRREAAKAQRMNGSELHEPPPSQPYAADEVVTVQPLGGIAAKLAARRKAMGG